MNKRAHIVAGACSGFIAFKLMTNGIISLRELNQITQYSLGEQLLVDGMTAVAGGVFGGLLPDIDHPNSSFGKKVPEISKLIKHRGILHSPFFYIIAFTILVLLASFEPVKLIIVLGIEIFAIWCISDIIKDYLKIGFFGSLIVICFIFISLFKDYAIYGTNVMCFFAVIGIFVGVISHLLLDFITKAGIPLLYPITKKKMHIIGLTTGKHDWIIETVFICITLICLIA